ncbi:MAG: sensor histidine kinase [Solirubrobacteraceae bacterium]
MRQLAYLLVAALVVAAFVHPIAYKLPELRATVETAITLLALTGAWLLRSRFAHTGRVSDLMQLAALLTLALFELCASALPAALNVRASAQLGTTRVLGDLVIAGLFAAAAFAPVERTVGDRRSSLLTMCGVSLSALLVSGLIGVSLHDKLVIASSHPLRGVGTATHRPFTLLLVLGTVSLLLYAAGTFVRRTMLGEPGTGWLLVVGIGVLAAARALFLVLQSVPLSWISSREDLLLLALSLLLASAGRQEIALRVRAARAAAIAERRRVAQDLHDGLAQDLAFIAAHGARIADELGDEHPITIAARRALAVSRGTISELSDMSSTPVDEALEAIAHELRDRFGIAITVYAHPDAHLAPDARQHVSRIAREAIANAARHGGADNVTVSLRPSGEGVVLRVRDDGRGIRPGADGAMPEGFGLRSMRERAAVMGGYLTVSPRKAGGTELEVVLP